MDGDAGGESRQRIEVVNVLDLAEARQRFARGMRFTCNGQSSGSRLREVLAPYRSGTLPGVGRLLEPRRGLRDRPGRSVARQPARRPDPLARGVAFARRTCGSSTARRARSAVSNECVNGLRRFTNHQSRITNHAFVLLLLSCLAAGPAAAGEAEWRMLYEQSDAHFQRGNLEQAELFAREALKEAETSLGEGSRATELSLARAVFMLRLARQARRGARARGARREGSEQAPRAGRPADRARAAEPGRGAVRAEEVRRRRAAAPPGARHLPEEVRREELPDRDEPAQRRHHAARAGQVPRRGALPASGRWR